MRCGWPEVYALEAMTGTNLEIIGPDDKLMAEMPATFNRKRYENSIFFRYSKEDENDRQRGRYNLLLKASDLRVEHALLAADCNITSKPFSLGVDTWEDDVPAIGEAGILATGESPHTGAGGGGGRP